MDVSFETNAVTHRLAKALLFYTSDHGHSASIVTAHDILEGPDQRPLIGPGTLPNVTEFDRYMQDISGMSQLQFLPPEVISISSSAIVWYRPATIRRVWFRTGSQSFDKFNGRTMLHPALLFVARKSLSVFALDKNSRPTPDSPIYRAPYPNIRDDGGVALCRAKPPGNKIISSIPLWEKSFYDTDFTYHARDGGAVRGITAQKLYTQLTARRKPARFPVRYLLPEDITLGKLLKKLGR